MINYGNNQKWTEANIAYLKHWKHKNSILTKRTAYDVLISSNLYLPSFISKCITWNYLDLLLTKKCMYVYKTDIICKNFDHVNLTTELIYFELVSILNDAKMTYNLGFDQFMLPDKTWLLNILYKIKPDLPLFNNQFKIETVEENLEMITLNDVIGEASFKNAKHPAFLQHLHNVKTRRQIKKQLYSKHKSKIQDKFHSISIKKIEKYEKDETIQKNEIDIPLFKMNDEVTTIDQSSMNDNRLIREFTNHSVSNTFYHIANDNNLSKLNFEENNTKNNKLSIKSDQYYPLSPGAFKSRMIIE